MRITHIVPHISAEASGPSYSVPRLCRAVAGLDHEVTLSCLAAGREIPGVALSIHPSWPVLQRFALSPRHTLALWQAANEVDIVHNHSLWSMVNVAAGWIVPGKRAKLVTSPRGTLSEWALLHSKRRKQLLWPLQRRVLEHADLLHATCEEEYAEIRKLGLKPPVLIAPNGIDLPFLHERRSNPDTRSLLFLSRVHPVKGIENLLDAWAGLERQHADWQLRIVGPGDADYMEELRARASRNGSRRVEFAGPLYGAEKDTAYRNADFFVLPTHSENFGMAVAEALSHECPAIVSHGAPWAGLEKEGCGWWVPNSVDSLRSTLESAMALPQTELHAMGARGRAWMERDFSWEAIAASMEAGYRWMLEGGAPPDCVKIK
ncbi:glycosyltransferase [Marinobacter changyiensis]|uniref:glycosyltransferase n=1 Tax=Marinobacter changyiensis TaxID=2604091 RepID=UPI001264958B|nr:glycosyltransferase [Marinobacter changyiensis]